MTTPNFNPNRIEFMKPTKQEKRRNAILVLLIAIGAVTLAILITNHIQGKESSSEKPLTERLMEQNRKEWDRFNTLRSKELKTTSEWFELCRLNAKLGGAPMPICEAMEYAKASPMKPFSIKGVSVPVDSETWRHILKSHTERYRKPNSNYKTMFHRYASLDDIGKLLAQAVAIVNDSNFNYSKLKSWRVYKRASAYVYIEGKPYCISWSPQRVISFYPVSPKNEGTKYFLNQKE